MNGNQPIEQGRLTGVLLLAMVSLAGVFTACGCTTTSRTPVATASATATPSCTADPGARIEQIVVFGGLDEQAAGLGASYRAEVRPGASLSPWTAEDRLPGGVDVPSVARSEGGWLFSLGWWDALCGCPSVDAWSARARSGALSGWSVGAPLPVESSWHQAAATDTFVYLIGGSRGGAAQREVWFSTVTAGVIVGPWTATTPLPTPVYGGYAWHASGHVYVTGGFRDGGWHNGRTFSGPVAQDGHILGWADVAALPIPHTSGGAAVADGFIYLAAGESTFFNSQTLAAEILPGGGLGPWSEGPELPALAYLGGVAATSGHLRVLGGGVLPNSLSSVYRVARSGTSFGTWQSERPLPVRATFCAAVGFE